MGTVLAFSEPDPPEPVKRRSKKRANGQGSVYQRQDGRWVGAAFILGSDGTYRRVPVYGSSADEVDAKLTALKARSNLGLPAESSGWVVKTYVEYWLTHVAKPKLRPTTLARYRSLLYSYVVPTIGKKRLSAVTPADVRLMLARAASSRTPGRKGQSEETRPLLSTRSVQQIHAVLRAVLSHAVREELLARNVAKLVQVATPVQEEIEPWTDIEARTFLAATRQHRLHALFVVALGLGLRRGELLGLRWADIDQRASRLRVTQTLQRVKGEGIILGPPKSRRSRRVLTMPAIVSKALADHRAAQAVDRKQVGSSWPATGWSSRPRPGGPSNRAT